jgi:hypothetical protein
MTWAQPCGCWWRPCSATGCWWAPAWTRRSSSCPRAAAALLTLGAAVVGLSDRPDGPTAVALWLALVLTVAHSLATARAAPTNFSQRAAAGDPARLAAIFDRFEHWQTARATLQVLTLLSVTWALAAEVANA